MAVVNRKARPIFVCITIAKEVTWLLIIDLFCFSFVGAKKFYGKFCAGAIDHISIRQLQCILLKVCLLLGVEVFANVAFEDLIEPTDSETGWKARVTPADHPLSQYEFDVLIGADGKRNTLHGFKRKEFRGKLAIAITANFINRHTEVRVPHQALIYRNLEPD